MPFELKSSIDGWMDNNALQWLYDRASEMQSVVEIGSWKGRSTDALLQGCPGPVFAVDHFKGSPNELGGAHSEALHHDIFPVFWTNVGHYKNLVVMRMQSDRASLFFADKSVDMVFIDGCHLYEAVMLDIISWKPKCRKLICGHDESDNSVKKALNDLHIEFKKTSGGIWFYHVST